MAGGYLNKCKECTKIDVRSNRVKKLDYYREYEKTRNPLPHRKEARKRYIATAKGKKAHLRANTKWINNNKIKRRASNEVNNAIKRGVIVKSLFCSECGNGGIIHGHHDNYNFPLEVKWLCPQCHTNWHKQNVAIF